MQRIHVHHSFARIARASLALIMMALALLGTARPAAAASVVNITPTGSGYTLRAHNGTPVQWLLRVSTSPVLAGPVFSSTARVTEKNSQGISLTDWTGVVLGLAPNTTHNYILYANSTPVASGSLGKTLHRSVVVRFDSIVVTNDSDVSGKGELTYQFKVNGVYHSELDYAQSTGSPVTLTFSPSRVVTNLFDGGATMPLQVEVQDDDCDFSTCIRPATFDSGSNSDNDWATASATITFKSDLNSFEQQVPYAVSGAVGFSGKAIVKVLYS